MKLAGPFPERWRLYWIRNLPKTSNGILMIDVDEECRKKPREEEDEDDTEDADDINGLGNKGAFVDSLCLTLHWEPMDRPIATNLLEYPWFKLHELIINVSVLLPVGRRSSPPSAGHQGLGEHNMNTVGWFILFTRACLSERDRAVIGGDEGTMLQLMQEDQSRGATVYEIVF
ncbi:hypothetical protein M405DRAFT_842159 [Rhizopogon salebrosus TDB-379]|nr:hypothetical protein M405DRAFT_842159 [Rhizopogon salebrosus TDB-379]